MDWKKLIGELLAENMTQVQIAEVCGVSQSTISDLYRLNDRSCSFALGSKLTALHASVKAKV